MPPQAELITGHSDKLSAEPPYCTETDKGFRGYCAFRVDIDSAHDAMTALGLPAIGDDIASFVSGGNGTPCECYEREARYIGGTRQAVSQRGGVCVVHCRFQTPGYGGTLPPPRLNRAYTVVKPSTTTIQRIYDARYPSDAFPIRQLPPPPNEPASYLAVVEPINNGRGASCVVGETQLLVVKFVRPQDIDIARLSRLQRFQRLNEEAVTVPPIINTTAQWTFQPGQLRYVSYEIPDEAPSPGELVRLTHILAMAPDFDYRWQQEDQYGIAWGGVRQNKLYLPESFAGLW